MARSFALDAYGSTGGLWRGENLGSAGCTTLRPPRQPGPFDRGGRDPVLRV